MRTLPNTALSSNFTRYDFIEGKALPKQAIELNWKNIAGYNEPKFIQLANFLESIVKVINMRFQLLNGGNPITLQMNAGYRCLEWELLQKRSGKSQHTIAAADIVPAGCDRHLAAEIMQYLFKIHNPRQGGHAGGFAIKRPSFDNGKLITVGFLHYDLRGSVARWEY